MAMRHVKSFQSIFITKAFADVASRRSFSAKANKGSKGGGAADAPKASLLSKEVKSTTVVGANILKEGLDPKIMADSEYPDWHWHLLYKRSRIK